MWDLWQPHFLTHQLVDSSYNVSHPPSTPHSFMLTRSFFQSRDMWMPKCISAWQKGTTYVNPSNLSGWHPKSTKCKMSSSWQCKNALMFAQFAANYTWKMWQVLNNFGHRFSQCSYMNVKVSFCMTNGATYKPSNLSGWHPNWLKTYQI